MIPITAILVSLILAFSFSELFKKINIPRVVGQITAGILLSIEPIYSMVFDSQAFDVFNFLANFGIILLFYYIGLQLSYKGFSQTIKKSFLVSLFKAFLPLTAGFAFMHFFLGFEILPSIIVGIVLSEGAQSVSVDLLEELKMLKTKLGRLIVNVGIITDVLELLILALVLSIFNVASIHSDLGVFFFSAAIFFVFILFAGSWVVRPVFNFFEREHSSTSRFMGAMVVLLFISYLSEFLGFGIIIGALAAGIITRHALLKDMAIPDWKEHDISRSIHIIAFGFFIPLFFVWIGLNTSIGMIADNYAFIFALSFLAIASVVGGTLIAIKLGKGSFKEGLVLGFGLSPKGDIGFVVGALALEAKIITTDLFSSLVAMSLIVTILTPIIFERLVLMNSKNH